MTRRTLSPVSSHRPYIEIVDNTDDIEEDGFVLLGVSKFSPVHVLLPLQIYNIKLICC